jgi:hypothetical protein
MCSFVYFCRSGRLTLHNRQFTAVRNVVVHKTMVNQLLQFYDVKYRRLVSVILKSTAMKDQEDNVLWLNIHKPLTKVTLVDKYRVTSNNFRAHFLVSTTASTCGFTKKKKKNSPPLNLNSAVTDVSCSLNPLIFDTVKFLGFRIIQI